MQRTDRKKVNNRDRKMHKCEDRNKNSHMKTLRGKNFKTAKKPEQRETQKENF